MHTYIDRLIYLCVCVCVCVCVEWIFWSGFWLYSKYSSNVFFLFPHLLFLSFQPTFHSFVLSFVIFLPSFLPSFFFFFLIFFLLCFYLFQDRSFHLLLHIFSFLSFFLRSWHRSSITAFIRFSFQRFFLPLAFPLFLNIPPFLLSSYSRSSFRPFVPFFFLSFIHYFFPLAYPFFYNSYFSLLLFYLLISIEFIIIIMSCRQHGYPWPSLATFPYRSSPPAGLLGYILCPHIAAVCKFGLVVLLLLGHMWGSIVVRHFFSFFRFYSPPIFLFIFFSFFSWVICLVRSVNIFAIFWYDLIGGAYITWLMRFKLYKLPIVVSNIGIIICALLYSE